jgi:non-ribosomal peptide synthetase component F
VSGQDNQDLPFEQVVEIVQPARRLDHTPLFQVMFSWNNQDVIASTTLDGLSVSPLDTKYQVAKFDLDLTLGEDGDEIAGTLGYATALFDAPTIQRHAGYLEAYYAATSQTRIPGQPDRPAQPHTNAACCCRSGTTPPFPSPSTPASTTCSRPKRPASPDAVALVHEDSEISYRELNTRANRLAHQLIDSGCAPTPGRDLRATLTPDDHRATGSPQSRRSLVPLDPAYPADRLAVMVSDSNPLGRPHRREHRRTRPSHAGKTSAWPARCSI